MKKIILIILLFISVKSSSQNAYTPMNLDTSCYWVNHLNIYFGGTTCGGRLVTFIEKDTLINAQQYFKMTTYASDSNVGGMCVTGFNSSCFIREDTALRKILRYTALNSEDTLLDFNLNAGDSLKIGIEKFRIDSTSIDTVNNIPRRMQWYHDFFGGKLSTIEGIGNVINFPYSGFGEWGTPYLKLQCYSKNGITYYGQGSCIKLAPLASAEFNKNSASLHFSENNLTIKNISNTAGLSVYNLLGNKVYSEKINDGNYAKDLSSVLQNGFYIVAVSDGKSKAVLKIVVK